MPPKIKTSVSEPGPVPKEALEFFKAKGLKPRFSYLEVWKEEHQLAFTVAKVMELQILAAVKTSLASAIEHGVTYQDWSKDIRPVLEKSGWYAHAQGNIPRRLTTIYDTNMRTARAAGQWERIERTKKTRPYLMYALGPSEKHRRLHLQWSGLILAADDPWWNKHYPPCGWGCKCHVIQLSRAQAEKYGGPVTAPPTTKVRWKNPLTGKTQLITEGVDPGFDYHKGKFRDRGVKSSAKNSKKKLSK